MIYVCIMDYSDDQNRVAAARPRHRAYMHDLLEKRRAISAGSLAPGHAGGLFLYQAASLDEANAMVEADPFVLEGAAKSYCLHEYEVHGANGDMLRATD